MQLMTRICQSMVLVGLLAATLNANVNISVFPAFAPTGPISPSWDDYVVNALIGIEADGSDISNRSTDPAAYETVKGPIDTYEMVYTYDPSATSFNSWRSWADPSQAFVNYSPAFRNEFGNRIHFGTRMVSDGSWPFALQQLEWSLDSDGPDDYFDQSGDFSTANYSPTRKGIDYVDGIKGNGNDIIYDDGESGALLVDELLYVGVGDGFNASGNFFVTDQDEIDSQLGVIMADCDGCADISFTGTYTLRNPSHSDPIISSGIVTISMAPAFGGDIDRNGVVDCNDMDLLTAAIAAGSDSIFVDVNGDSNVNFNDVEYAVDEILHTYFGDSNCDGQFNSNDLIKIFQAGKYETGKPAVWTEGDWDANGVFESGDLILAFIQGGYELGPRWVDSGTLASTVPEPSSLVLIAVGIALMLKQRRGT